MRPRGYLRPPMSHLPCSFSSPGLQYRQNGRRATEAARPTAQRRAGARIAGRPRAAVQTRSSRFAQYPRWWKRSNRSWRTQYRSQPWKGRYTGGKYPGGAKAAARGAARPSAGHAAAVELCARPAAASAADNVNEAILIMAAFRQWMGSPLIQRAAAPRVDPSKPCATNARDARRRARADALPPR
jgi:hypothetical protein